MINEESDKNLNMGAINNEHNNSNEETNHVSQSAEKMSTLKNPATPACPLCQIPASAWKKLFKQPFRKRHPVIFWGLAICLLIFIFSIIFNGEDDTPRIALVKIEGPILDSASDIAWITKITQMPRVKGILVRVNSPGGGAAASQEIYYALKAAAEHKPVAISMGATAASGGLMVSMAGERIFANPSTITGSIGVRMDIPQLQGLLNKLGIGQETLVSGPYKDAASYLRPLTPEDRKYLQGIVDNMFEQFVKIVATSRKMDMEKALSLANGKIYTGQQALETGLIDELGTQAQAHKWLCEKLNISPEQKLLEKNVKNSQLLNLLLQLFGKNALQEIGDFLSGNSQPVFLYR